MKVYDDKHIKNVAFVGAHKSGKTTLAETMLFEAGLINRRGDVEGKTNAKLQYLQRRFTQNGATTKSTL